MNGLSRPARGRMLFVLLALSGVAGAGARLRSQDPPPDDDAADRVAFGKLAFENDCLMCHAAGIVEQQRLTPTQWKAEIQKMIDQGATVAPEDVPQIQAFVETTFGPNNRREAALRDAVEVKQTLAGLPPEPLVGTDPDRGRALFSEHCAKCHGADARGGEPGQNLVEHVSLLAVDPFLEVVTAGRRKMPGFRDVLDGPRVRDIQAWMRTLRYEPGLPPPEPH